MEFCHAEDIGMKLMRLKDSFRHFIGLPKLRHIFFNGGERSIDEKKMLRYFPEYISFGNIFHFDEQQQHLFL